MSTIVNRGGQIQWISSLRGILVFLVFFSHLTVLPLHKDLLFIIGRIGVAGFFLISGCLAVTSLERRNVKQFLFNRFMRLYPVYWLLLLMIFFLTEGHDAKELFWNMTLFEEFVGYEAMIGASWMLPIMIVFFVLLTVMKRKKSKINWFYYATCAGSLAIGSLRYWTGKPCYQFFTYTQPIQDYIDFFQAIKKHYDISDINIIGISDRRFEGHEPNEECFGYKVYAPSELKDLNPDYVLVATKMYIGIIEDLYYDTLKDTKIKIKPLLKKGLFTLIKEIWG